ncbi:hypothetical protein C8N36_114118 [Pelagimonas varians]|uniref:Uncharacterized protein n=1 Tax=Pelagimonas varians TaxID=696760 RepID=A0A238KXY9_9RHOB|nr:hypothetical protein C8N36_114118 [Pelagimonas varians]SMX47704.1 hypothetical protein PEV8663_03617 [Pelagimonas varians]
MKLPSGCDQYTRDVEGELIQTTLPSKKNHPNTPNRPSAAQVPNQQKDGGVNDQVLTQENPAV